MFQCCLIHIARPDASSILMENLGTHTHHKQTNTFTPRIPPSLPPLKKEKGCVSQTSNGFSSHLKETTTTIPHLLREGGGQSSFLAENLIQQCHISLVFQDWEGASEKTHGKTARWFLVWMSNTIFPWKLAKSGYFKFKMYSDLRRIEPQDPAVLVVYALIHSAFFVNTYV